MTSNGVYIRMSGRTKSPHWLPYFVPDTLLLQEITYKFYVHDVIASLHKSKKGLWPHFPLSMGVYKIESFKYAKEEVSILSSFKLKEVTFWRHDPQEKLKEYLQQISFTWSYAHEDLLHGNGVSSRYCWNLIFWPQKNLCKLIRKLRDKGPRLKKIKLLLSRRFYQGPGTVRRSYDIHPYQFIALILVKKV